MVDCCELKKFAGKIFTSHHFLLQKIPIGNCFWEKIFQLSINRVCRDDVTTGKSSFRTR